MGPAGLPALNVQGRARRGHPTQGMSPHPHVRANRRTNHPFARQSAGVTWNDLSVTGAGGMKIHLRTFPDAVVEFILSPLIMFGPYFGLFTPAPKTLLHSFNGVARPGEMVLVLGRPGSGCSTFLKSIANQRDGYLRVDGDVRYAGIEATEFKKRFAGEVVYNAEDDMHHATLTVEQTLDFALFTKTPGKRVPGQTKDQFRSQVINTLLKMVSLPSPICRASI